MGQPQRPHTRRVERDVMRAVWRHLGHSILMELLAIGATSFLQAFRAGASEGAEDVPVLRDKAAGIRAAAGSSSRRDSTYGENGQASEPPSSWPEAMRI